MYGCEVWTLSKELQNKLEATEMWFPLRMLRMSWFAKKSNETVLREADITRSLIHRICKHLATYFGHVMRREKLEKLTIAMTARRKQRKKMLGR